MITTMSPLVSTLSLVLALHPGDGRTHDHAPSASSPSSARQQASQAFKQNQYVAAATQFEALWQRDQEPRDLFNAGLAWFAAGEHALAIRRFETYLGLGDRVPSEYLARAEAQLSRARQHTVEVGVTVIPAAAAKGEVRLRGTRRAAATPGGLPSRAIEFSPPRAYGAASRAVTTIRVDPGQWDMVLEAPGYRAASRTMTVQAGQSGFTMDIELQPDPNAALAAGPAPALDAAGFEVVFAVTADAHAYVEGDMLITASRDGAAPRRCTIPVLFPEPPGTCSMRLEPGAWQVSASGPGIADYTMDAELSGANQRVDLAVSPANVVVEGPEDERADEDSLDLVPLATRVRLSRDLSIAGTVAAIGGLSLTIAGDVRFAAAELATNEDISEGVCAGATADGKTCQARMIGPMRLRSAGLGLFGGAAGLYAAAATGRYDVRTRVWHAELGVGAALSLVGVVWLAARAPALDATMSKLAINFDDMSRIQSLTAERMAGAFFLGAGVGLLGGSLTGLLVQRRALDRRAAAIARGLTPYWTAAGGGLALQGRF